MWINRTLCDTLEEMRTCNVTKNYSYLEGLIEEAQVMGNRMEAKLNDMRDIEDFHAQISKLRKEIKALEKEKESHGDAHISTE